MRQRYDAPVPQQYRYGYEALDVAAGWGLFAYVAPRI